MKWAIVTLASEQRRGQNEKMVPEGAVTFHCRLKVAVCRGRGLVEVQMFADGGNCPFLGSWINSECKYDQNDVVVSSRTLFRSSGSSYQHCKCTCTTCLIDTVAASLFMSVAKPWAFPASSSSSSSSNSDIIPFF